MQLFSFTLMESNITLEGSPETGLERLLLNGQEIGQKRNFGANNDYTFLLPTAGEVHLHFKVDAPNGLVLVKLFNQDKSQTLYEQQHDVPLTAPNGTATRQPKGHMATFFVMGLKLLKSAKVIKVALLGTAIGGWSLIFSWQFALVLVSVLVFHEYGHLRAMKYFGLKTKGMYLIPFVGGLAIGERAKTQWQDVVISLMGPIFGLLMSIAFYLAYLVTENHFIGLVASLSSLINLFNLLPVYPLDGGRAIKAIVFSAKKYWGFALLLSLSAAGFALAASAGWGFICVFIIIGLIDLLVSWRDFANQDITPLDIYGMWFSIIWYAVTIALFVFIIIMIAKSGLPGSNIADVILSS